MTPTAILYIVFCAVILLALIFDLGLLSKKNAEVSLKMAVWQTIFWVLISLAFCGFLLYENAGGHGKEDAIRYLSAYLLEWSLSIDNIFVFIIIFAYFKVPEGNYSRVLLMGVLMAIIFRIIFITLGSTLVAKFDWIMYFFGAFLLFTGVKMFRAKEDEQFSPKENWIFRFMKKYMRTTDDDAHGHFFIKKDNKTYFTKLSMVVVMLGLIDLVFAIDSIPAVFSIIPNPKDRLLIYSSNIFAVLGLRSLFFLLKGAANRFDYLQHGIATVLLFIGAKMLLEKWVHLPVWICLMVIVVCIGSAILYSIFKKQEDEDITVLNNEKN